MSYIGRTAAKQKLIISLLNLCIDDEKTLNEDERYYILSPNELTKKNIDVPANIKYIFDNDLLVIKSKHHNGTL